MKSASRLYAGAVLLIIVTSCAAPSPRYRDDCFLVLEKVKASGMQTMFPAETEDFLRTFSQAEREVAIGQISTADSYFTLAIGKGELLERQYLAELRKREQASRIEFEQKRQALLEIEQLKERQQAEQKADALAKDAERVRKAEARRRIDKSRLERDIQPVARHTVKRGETLPQIAALPEVYGESSLWPLIYRANRDQIGNPSVLWPGQVLRIPRNLDKNDISEARRFATGRSLR